MPVGGDGQNEVDQNLATEGDDGDLTNARRLSRDWICKYRCKRDSQKEAECCDRFAHCRVAGD
jgi:hypothetical protein